MVPLPVISKPRAIYCNLFIFYNPSDTFVKVLTLNSIAFGYIIIFSFGWDPDSIIIEDLRMQLKGKCRDSTAFLTKP